MVCFDFILLPISFQCFKVIDITPLGPLGKGAHWKGKHHKQECSFAFQDKYWRVNKIARKHWFFSPVGSFDRGTMENARKMSGLDVIKPLLRP